ncbi:MAG: PEP-utilizing enzyme [Candidatus Marsarchaeota archaeon]|nr:PEP-utilizing enzyme [Candidatus Marsarchaeota archaeon]
MEHDEVVDMEEYIKPLSSYGEPNEVGGKAYNLMRLKHANYCVADGFVLTTDLYRYWNGNGKFPPDLPKKLEKSIEWFSYSMRYPFIVRSSATVEDAEKASFAGIFSSYPNANSMQDLIVRIEKIYQDVGSPRVQRYCDLHGIDKRKIEMAVLIQQQLAPEYSGILFTRNPVNKKDETILEYVKGVPWDLVSGRARANRMVLDDKSERFRKLYQISREIEEFLGAPQDIEWAYDGKEYWILQSRPITTLKTGAGGVKNLTRPSRKSVTLTGTAASLGYITGRVQYIYDDVPAEEAERIFRKGNILATELLFPEYDGVVSKASGVIAHNNSINSHVAIVAREIGVPCIVGVELKDLSRYAADFDEIVLDANNGRIIVPNPRLSVIRDKSEIVYAGLPEWTKKVDTIGLALIGNLKKAILEEDIKSFEDGIDNIITYIVDNAQSRPDISRPLFHRLCGFLQDDLVYILLTKHSQKEVLERLAFVDSNRKADSQEIIDKMYLIAKRYIRSLDTLEVNGKKIFELELPETKCPH